jgi:hypothetical protein
MLATKIGEESHLRALREFSVNDSYVIDAAMATADMMPWE